MGHQTPFLLLIGILDDLREPARLPETNFKDKLLDNSLNEFYQKFIGKNFSKKVHNFIKFTIS